jgi:hypothetical protein
MLTRFLARTLIGTAAHFVVSTIVAMLAHGWDFDQLTSRSAVSRVSAIVEPVLWAPHALILGAVPAGQISRYSWVIPVALVANSVAYGLLVAAIWSVLRRGK